MNRFKKLLYLITPALIMSAVLFIYSFIANQFF